MQAARFCPRSTVKRKPQNFQPKRSISRSASAAKALPFFLNTIRAAAQDTVERKHGSDKYLRMLMFGKPGAGKGTLTARLVKKYDIMSISSGDLLRQHISEGTEVGRQAEEIVAHGGLLPDEVMLKVVSSQLDLLQNKHWILDGFPRTLVQGEMLDKHLREQGVPISLVVNLDVPDQIILSRISDRWVHLPSGRVYNYSYNRPKVDGYDDETGEPLTKRPDDDPEIFARRLSKFYSTTSPLLTYFASAAKQPINSSALHSHQHPHQLSFPVRPPHRLILESLSGLSSDEIWPLLDAAVKNAFPSLRERPESLENKRRHSLSEVIMSRGAEAKLERNTDH
ncbi:adenylate kinase [Mycena floridula]|nr:adenylate kinase [Mycena floridula]